MENWIFRCNKEWFVRTRTNATNNCFTPLKWPLLNNLLLCSFTAWSVNAFYMQLLISNQNILVVWQSFQKSLPEKSLLIKLQRIKNSLLFSTSFHCVKDMCWWYPKQKPTTCLICLTTISRKYFCLQNLLPRLLKNHLTATGVVWVLWVLKCPMHTCIWFL